MSVVSGVSHERCIGSAAGAERSGIGMRPSAGAFPIQLLVVSRSVGTMGIGLSGARRVFECLWREVNRLSRIWGISGRELVPYGSHAWPRGHWDSTGVHTFPSLTERQAMSMSDVGIEDGQHYEESRCGAGWTATARPV